MSEELYNNDPFMKLNPLIEECIDEFYMNPDDAGKISNLFDTIIIAMAQDGHILIPVETPDAALKIFDPDKIKVGDTIQAEEDLHWKLIHLTNDEGKICMPIFTSQDKMEESGAGGCSVISFFMDEYFKQFLEMENVEGIIINPGERSIFLNRDIVAKLLADCQAHKSKPHTPGKDAYFVNPQNIKAGLRETMAEYVDNNIPEVEKIWFTGIHDGEEDSLLFAVKMDTDNQQQIFDRMNTMIILMRVDMPVDFMACEDKPWEGAELIYERMIADKKYN